MPFEKAMNYGGAEITAPGSHQRSQEFFGRADAVLVLVAASSADSHRSMDSYPARSARLEEGKILLNRAMALFKRIFPFHESRIWGVTGEEIPQKMSMDTKLTSRAR